VTAFGDATAAKDKGSWSSDSSDKSDKFATDVFVVGATAAKDEGGSLAFSGSAGGDPLSIGTSRELPLASMRAKANVNVREAIECRKFLQELQG